VRRRMIAALAVLLLLWASRLAALETLPLHNDEGLHLTRAVEVWNLHPFWAIADGKIINHWPIALFYPQHAPVFVSRIATVFIAVIGLAAGYALVRRRWGQGAALLAGILWLTNPYLFFFERLAQSDAEAGALVVVTLWAGLRLAERGRRVDAALTGLALAAATLFKFTAAPFALMVAVVVLWWGSQTWRRRFEGLLIIGLVGAACFAVPLVYVGQRGGDFAVALGWLGGGSGDRLAAAGRNLATLWDQLTGFGVFPWPGVAALALGLIALTRWRRKPDGRPGAVLVLSLLLPPAAIVLLSSQVEPRHFVVALPLALTLAGAGLGDLLRRTPDGRVRVMVATGLAIALAAAFVPFAGTAYTDPGGLPLPDRAFHQYVVDHSAGFGLREAVLAFPQTIGPPGTPVVASMFPDSCKRANFYDGVGYGMTCPAAPGLSAIQEALAVGRVVYVLAEGPPIGFEPAALSVTAIQVAAYPRPGETAENASVTLWRLEAAD